MTRLFMLFLAAWISQSLTMDKESKALMGPDFKRAKGYMEKYGEQAVVRAAGYAPFNVLKRLIELGADVNQRGKYNDSALIAAVARGRYHNAEYLLQKGAKVNARGDLGMTALHRVYCLNGQSMPMIELLLSYGADLEAKDRLHGRTPLMWSIVCGLREANAKAFMDLGANLNVVDTYGRTPLMCLARVVIALRDTLSMMDLVLQYDVAVNKKTRLGWTALHYAARSGKKEIVEKLLGVGAEPSMRNLRGKTALDIAREKGHDEIVAILENAPTQVKDTGLTKAVSSGIGSS